MEQEIKEMTINGITYVPKSDKTSSVVNTDGLQAVLIRSYAAGVHFGYLLSKEDTLSGRVVKLINTRRVWYWAGANSLSELALKGTLKPNECKFSVELPENEIVNCIEIIPLSGEALINLKNVKVWQV